jgi:ketosteroid isomerase-like protein
MNEWQETSIAFANPSAEQFSSPPCRSAFGANAIVMPPDAPFVKGRDNIKQFWGSAIQQLGLKDVRLNTVDLEIAGDIAHEVGEAVLTLESGGTTGKYVVVWKKVGGQWRLHRDIWNAKGA